MNRKKIFKIIKELKDYRIFFLIGEMGTGKTFFVKNFLKDERVTSPTFNFLNIYDNTYHFDLYKLWEKKQLNKETLEKIGFFHSLEENQVFVEWANLLDNLEEKIKIFSPIVKIFFSYKNISFEILYS